MDPVFEDGLGTRRLVTDRGAGDPGEVLSLRDSLTEVPGFEQALRERIERLNGLRHGSYARVRGVEPGGNGSLTLVSDHVVGVRLSTILATSEQRSVPLEIEAALCLIRQLVPAVALLHEAYPDVAHGAIGPERIVVTPNGRIVLVEHVLGPSLELLRYSHSRYWQELRVALPRTAGLPRFDRRADVVQVGTVALALILGRPLGADEYPGRIGEALGSAWAVTASGGLEPLPAVLRTWLSRALHFDARNGFPSAIEALAELDEVLSDSGYIGAPAALQKFLADVALASPQEPAPAVEPPAPIPIPAPVPVRIPVPVSVRVVAPDPVPLPTPAPAPVPPPAPPAVAATPTPSAVPVAPVAVQVARATPEPVLYPEPIRYVEPPVAPPALPRAPLPPPMWPRIAAAAAVIVVLVSGGAFAARRFLAPSAAAATTGTLVVNTNPTGLAVIVDEKPRGVTPVTLSLAPGKHSVRVGAGDTARILALTITAGAETSQYLELPKTAPTRGHLQIRSEPGGARVAVDGQARGTAPLTVDDLAPGVHTVLVENDLGSVSEQVTVEAGTTASLVVPLGTTQGVPVSGWVSLSAPVEMQLFENGRLIGTTRSDRIMVSAGRHDIEVVNEALGYRATRAVQVTPGKVSPIKLEWPKGSIALNALPWADVWIDGDRIGETPIGNVAVPIGSHDVVFRHPDLGEQRYTAVVTLTAPVRLSVDMRKK